jgi:hypothetical protein
MTVHQANFNKFLGNGVFNFDAEPFTIASIEARGDNTRADASGLKSVGCSVAPQRPKSLRFCLPIIFRHDAFHEFVEQGDREGSIAMGRTPDHAFLNQSGAGRSKRINLPSQALCYVP